MATINQHISNIRGLIKKHTRSEGIYTDSFLYQLFKGARATLIKQQLNKLNNVSGWNYQRFDVKLELINDTICDSTVGCKALRSTIKVPKPLRSMYKDEVVFYTLGKQRITIVKPDRWDIYKDDEFKKYIGSIVDGYLYIWNNKDLKCITAFGIWEDPIEWSDCCGDADPCYDVTTSEFPIDEDLKLTAYVEVLKVLRIPLELLSDNTNDSNNES